VASSITKFPAHTVNILTSAVIWCQRAALKRTAFEYATILMNKDNRNLVDKKFRKKIEAIVRRPQPQEEEEVQTACPYCEVKLPETSLDCPNCKNTIPYCACTGKHMLLDDWCHCPSCKFPQLYSVFIERIHVEKTCDMCGQTITLTAINKDPVAAVQRALLGDNADKKLAAMQAAAADDKLSPEMEKKFKDAELKHGKQAEESLEMKAVDE